MKKSYVKLMIFESIILLFLIINIFNYKIINNYLIILSLLLLNALFIKLFGIEKQKKRYTKELITDISIILIIFFILYYLFGIITGFYRTNNYFTFYGIKTIIIPSILIIFLKEHFRFLFYTKIENCKTLINTTFIMFVLIDLINLFKISNFTTIQSVFYFVALSLLPIIANNLVANYIIKKSNYIVNIFWLLVINIYVYILPIIPNVGDYITSIIKIILPLVIYKKVNTFYENIEDTDIIRDYNKKYFAPYLIAIVTSIILIYFTSGFFRFQTVAIASGSMTPSISKGDIVLIDKKHEELKVGDVIAYNYKDVIVVHRLIKIVEKDETFYYTKGDANNLPDNYAINREDIIGIVNITIPYMGLPAVWLNGL